MSEGTDTGKQSIVGDVNITSLDNQPMVSSVGPTTPSLSTPATVEQLGNLRGQFRALLIGNPNYFGHLPTSAFKPIVQITGNTTYEEVKCVGFNPQFNRLEAVVAIKQVNGYGTDICGSGSPEYVRFFADWNNNGTWTHLGMVSFTSHNIASGLPLEYAVTLTLSPQHKFCFLQNLPKVRAVLSWDVPPSLDPNGPVVWGNVFDTHIQISGFNVFSLNTLLQEAKIHLPTEFEDVVDLSQPVQSAGEKKLSAVDLQAMYKGTNVEVHRFGFAEIHQLLSSPAMLSLSDSIAKSSIYTSDVISKFLSVNGDTSYEELTCVGLDPNQSALVGIIKAKRTNGYSGTPCSGGSTEYVAFWVDWGDGSWSYQGTSTVNTHDFSSLPADGLSYSVFLPIDTLEHTQLCSSGAKVAKVRAILSWQVAPTNPNYVPTWGNRVESSIQIAPGVPVTTGVHLPFLNFVGRTPENMIGSNGLANGHTTTGLDLINSPFGGSVLIQGLIAYPIPGLAYRIMRKLHSASDAAYIPVTSEPSGLELQLSTFTGTSWSLSSLTLHDNPVGSGYYSYEDYAWYHSIGDHVMGTLVTTSADEGQLLDLRIDVNVDGNPTHDLHSNVVTILVDNTAPTASVSITEYSRNQGPRQPANDCGTFEVGDTIYGKYDTYDLHFRDFSLYVLASGPIQPPSGSYPTLVYGANGEWSLDTTHMAPCGYVIELMSQDRTDVNGGDHWRTYATPVGFCLEAAPLK